MRFIDYLDQRFQSASEIKKINQVGISSGFDGFRTIWEMQYLYKKFKPDILQIIEDTGYTEKDLKDEFDDDETLMMKLVWFAVGTYCLSRTDSLEEESEITNKI